MIPFRCNRHTIPGSRRQGPCTGGSLQQQHSATVSGRSPRCPPIAAQRGSTSKARHEEYHKPGHGSLTQEQIAGVERRLSGAARGRQTIAAWQEEYNKPGHGNLTQEQVDSVKRNLAGIVKAGRTVATWHAEYKKPGHGTLTQEQIDCVEKKNASGKKNLLAGSQAHNSALFALTEEYHKPDHGNLTQEQRLIVERQIAYAAKGSEKMSAITAMYAEYLQPGHGSLTKAQVETVETRLESGRPMRPGPKEDPRLPPRHSWHKTNQTIAYRSAPGQPRQFLKRPKGQDGNRIPKPGGPQSSMEALAECPAWWIEAVCREHGLPVPQLVLEELRKMPAAEQ